MGGIAVHGFGRIGRSAVKAALRDGLWVPNVISDIKDPETLAALFEYDTNYGRWPQPVTGSGGIFSVGEHAVDYHDVKDSIPAWGDLGVDLVIDSTGRATTREGAEPHLARGARRVLVSGPSKTIDDCDAVLLRGVNDASYDPDKHRIVSMASCTTNALAPVIKVLRETVGIEHGLFSTVHAYTNTQTLTDQPMSDRRDSWAAAENIIPAASGAAKALAFVWPDLKVTGKAYRVPVRTGSIVELNAVVGRATTREEIVSAFRDAVGEPAWAGVLGVLEDEWASARIVGETRSCIVDLPLTQVLGDDLVSVAAWYDNEMGYSTRLAELALKLSS